MKANVKNFNEHRVQNFDGFDHLDDFKNTPLHSAAFAGDVYCIKLLIEQAKCSVDASNLDGISPLLIIEQRNIDV
jgi:ankyrin repeat protein